MRLKARVQTYRLVKKLRSQGITTPPMGLFILPEAWPTWERIRRRLSCRWSILLEDYLDPARETLWRLYEKWSPLQFVTVYDCDRSYGGPEEGGWWYEVGAPVKWFGVCLTKWGTIKAMSRAKEYADETNAGRRYGIDSVLSEGECRVRVEKAWPRPFPKYRPYYE